MTELSPVSHLTPPGQFKPGSVGVTVPNTETMIVDTLTCESLGIGVDGEVWVRGPQVMKGYLNNEAATADTIDDDGWLHTGDIGHIGADGHLFIIDRLKELIKYKGFQVPPAELESVLLTHPAVADAAVVGAPDDEAGEIPVGFVVLEPDQSVSEDELMAFVAGQIANYNQLRRVTFIDAVPRSASGKVLRRLLRDQLKSHHRHDHNNEGNVMLVTSEAYAIGSISPSVRELTIGGLLREAAAAEPDRVALVAGLADPAARRSWTYAELLAEATTAAQALRTKFESGDRIAVWAPNYPEWIILQFASALAGTILVTVNPAFRAAEVEYVLKQSRSNGVVTANEFRGTPMRATIEEIQPKCPELREVICFDEWDELLAAADDFVDDLPDPAATDAVMIQYTSGTTGFPKGALLHHRGLVNNGAHTADRAGYADGEVVIGACPLFHTAGCVITVLGAVATKSTLIYEEAFDPGLALELIETFRGTALMAVPTMLVAITEHPDFATTDLSSVKSVISGGSLVPAPMVRKFEEELDARFTIVFGQTECSPVASMANTDDSIEDKAGTIGRPMPGVEVKIVDQNGETVPVGAVGEYCTRGYHVMHHYFENPDATAQAIDVDGWLHTGDLCAMDDRGYCTVEGRLKDMIIRGGENIYPRELEDLLFAHPTVGEVAVVGLPDDRMGEVVAAFIRPAPGNTVSKEELFAYMREHLAPHKTPKHWVALDAFADGLGKIQKYKLRDQWAAGEYQEL